MSRSTIGKLCLVVIALQFLGFFIVTVVAGKDGVSDKKPFIAQIDEIAVSDSNVYTLDSTFRKICKYDLKGNYLHTISFSTMGSSRIFCDDQNRLGHSVDVYDDSGSVVDSYKIQYADVIENGSLKSYDTVQTVEKAGVTYRFDNRFIADSLLYFGDDPVVVESAGYHLRSNVYRLIAIGAFGFAFYSIVAEYIKRFKAKQTSEKSDA